MPIPETEQQGVGQATKSVAEHASALVRLELELAALELRRKLISFALGIGLVLGAVLFLLYALGFGLASAAAGIATAVPMWGALLIVTGVLFVLTMLLAAFGLMALKRGTPPVPEQAIREAKLTTEALKDGRH
jgi:Putative Actinobacterial Holin-X, holin superfamily III